MGEMSDAITEGECCALCGVFFEQGHGFPVLCLACWSAVCYKQRVIYAKATEPEAGGAS